ncbi:glycosyltransferase family 4 protein [Geobacter hydrogenophilus]|nr:glycosyltransferase family 1 protein [Geobacter hydrogenophilus]MBT0895218.1 glycosyltransferase family 4 protein [Geobacter hydrogenophilus]
MNIAVIIEHNIEIGGNFQHALSIIKILNERSCPEYNFKFFTTNQRNVDHFKQLGIELLLITNVKQYKLSYIAKLVASKFIRNDNMLSIQLDILLNNYNIDLLYFISHSELALKVSRINYIFTVLDLCHRDHAEFPEVRRSGEFERREGLFQYVLPKAARIITDSEVGKANIVRRYNIDSDRIMVVPFFPAESILETAQKDVPLSFIDIKKKYNIPDKYIFYPAQFWAHKNHVYILHGLKILKEKYQIILHAIFSGSDQGNLEFVLSKADELGIRELIHYVGFVDNREMPCLYKQSLALVMPTYFGPTNIPPLEAFMLGVPVLYSDLPGLREQVAGAALLLDLHDPESLARQLIKVIKGDDQVKTLVERGRQKVFTFTEDNYWEIIRMALDDYSEKMRCWK